MSFAGAAVVPLDADVQNPGFWLKPGLASVQ